MRKYDIISINCDCASGRIAVTSGRSWVHGPKCPFCGTQLGFMQWDRIYSGIEAGGDIDALQKYRELESREMI